MTLTAYQLSCGYKEQSTLPNNVRITLWKEHGVYHVRAMGDKRIFWDSYKTLTEARERFSRALRELR